MAKTTPNNYTTYGYEYDFVDSIPDRMLCEICHLPSRDPYLSVCCGHLFCKSCVENVRNSPVSNTCPVCRSEEFITFPNKAINREIKSLHVFCTNKIMGCEWQGELNDINNHLGNSNGCQFEKVKCFNECGKIVQRRYLTRHVMAVCPRRKVNCKYCHDIGEYHFVEGQHKKDCPKLPLPCPNKCEIGSVPREDMNKHRMECQLEVIGCSNDCEVKLERQHLSNHVKNLCPLRKVNCQYCHKTGEHRFIKGQHKEECPKLPLPCPNKCEVGSVPCEDMEAHRKDCPLEMIYCEYYNVGCEARMARKDQEKHKKENMEEHLMKTNLALTGTICELTNTKQDLIDTTSALTDTKCKLTDTTNQLAIALQHISTLKALVYLSLDKTVTTTNSTAVIEASLGWSVKLAAMAMMSISGDQVCPVTLKISNFNDMKSNKVIWYSNSFYTEGKGYKMCTKVYPNGYVNGKGAHLSCYLNLLKGPYDDDLWWPLRDKFEIKLLNETTDSQHHSEIVYYENSPQTSSSRVTEGNRASGLGKQQFISNKDLYKITSTCQYLKDDCLFFQIIKL